MVSSQGVVLTDVGRRTPQLASATTSETVDRYDPDHHHLVWSHNAGAQVRTARLSTVVSSPTGIWIPGGHPYTVEASGVWWTASFVVGSCPSSWRRIATITLDEVVAPILAHLHYHPGQDESSGLFSAVVTHLEDHFVAEPSPLRFPTDPRAREVADGIIAEPASARDLHDWAVLVGASERTLRRLFTEQTGVPFRTWRGRARLHAAVRLLSSGRSVGEVARRCGYGSTIAFARAFVRDYGMTPSDYLARREPAARRPARPVSRSWPVESPVWPLGSPGLLEALSHLVNAAQGDEMTSRARASVIAATIGVVLIAAACGSEETASDAGTPTETAPRATTDSSGLTTEGGSSGDGTSGTESSTDDVQAADEGDADMTDTGAGGSPGDAAAYPRVIEHALGSTVIETRPELIHLSETRLAFGNLLGLGVEVDMLVPFLFGDFQPVPESYLERADDLGLELTEGLDVFSLSIEEMVRLAPDLFLITDYDAEFIEGLDELSEQIPVVVVSSESQEAMLDDLAEIFALDPERVAEAAQTASDALASVSFPDDIEVSVFTSYNFGELEVEVYNETSPTGLLLEGAGVDVREQDPVEERRAYLAEESLELLDADVMVNLTTYGPTDVLDDSVVFQNVPAVQDGRFIHLSYDESFAINFPSLMSAPLAAQALTKIEAIAQE
ncbi:MAG: helix-turn-helix domain-containing protein [Actinomycetota bacterium]